MLNSIKKCIEINYPDLITPSVFGMPMLNENMQWNVMLNFNLKPTSYEIDVSEFQSKKYYEHENLPHTESLQRLISHGILRLHAKNAKHHSSKSILKILNITQKNWKNMEC